MRNITVNWISRRPHHITAAGITYNTAVGVDCGTEELCCDLRHRQEISPIPHRDRLWGWCSLLFNGHQAKRSGPEADLPPPPTAKAWIGGAILYTTIRCHGLWTGKLTSYFYSFTHTRMVTTLFDKNCSPSSQHCPILSKFVQDICFVLNNT